MSCSDPIFVSLLLYLLNTMADGNICGAGLTTKENLKDLDTLWVCTDCGTPSLYHSDIEEHKSKNDHHHVVGFDLETGKIVAHYAQ
jgi:hypothetical protein